MIDCIQEPVGVIDLRTLTSWLRAGARLPALGMLIEQDFLKVCIERLFGDILGQVLEREDRAIGIVPSVKE